MRQSLVLCSMGSMPAQRVEALAAASLFTVTKGKFEVYGWAPFAIWRAAAH